LSARLSVTAQIERSRLRVLYGDDGLIL